MKLKTLTDENVMTVRSVESSADGPSKKSACSAKKMEVNLLDFELSEIKGNTFLMLTWLTRSTPRAFSGFK